MQSPILITGVPRSGVSLLANVLATSSIHFGKVCRGADYMVGCDVLRVCEKPILRVKGAHSNGFTPQKIERSLHFKSVWEEQLRILMGGKGQWAFADHRILLLQDLWNAVYPGAKWVFVERNEKEICQSVQKTAYLRKKLLSGYNVQGDSEKVRMALKVWYLSFFELQKEAEAQVTNKITINLKQDKDIIGEKLGVLGIDFTSSMNKHFLKLLKA